LSWDSGVPSSPTAEQSGVRTTWGEAETCSKVSAPLYSCPVGRSRREREREREREIHLGAGDPSTTTDSFASSRGDPCAVRMRSGEGPAASAQPAAVPAAQLPDLSVSKSKQGKGRCKGREGGPDLVPNLPNLRPDQRVSEPGLEARACVFCPLCFSAERALLPQEAL
jgi:hypothetical protein